MAWFALLLIVVAFGGMALAFGRSERAEERRILARAEAVLARGPVANVAPEASDEAAPVLASEDAAPAGRLASVA